jgi:hypothetical protein
MRVGLVLVGLTLVTLGSAVRAHPPGMEDPERQQRRMELRQHLMQERERWRPESQGGPREAMRQEMRIDKRPEMRNEFQVESRNDPRERNVSRLKNGARCGARFGRHSGFLRSP